MEAEKVCYGLVGMLWFDNSKDSFEERVRRAAQYYCKKYGKEVTVVEVPVYEITVGRIVDRLVVVPCKSLLPHHMILFDCERDNASQPSLEEQL
ncbi:MAG: hypothetical protein IMZ62_16920 [Chloroflexi bacterium]|nr:hypothetical protein [Chloroflexota bacterium]